MFGRDPKKGYDGYCYMSTYELVTVLRRMNPSWAALYENDLNELVVRAVFIEEELKKLKHVGQEVLVDGPLTGTSEEINRKYKLRREQLNIMNSIVTSFKENTNMESLLFSEKKFLYSSREECKKSSKR